jgi:hypothetical protein
MQPELKEDEYVFYSSKKTAAELLHLDPVLIFREDEGTAHFHDHLFVPTDRAQETVKLLQEFLA